MFHTETNRNIVTIITDTFKRKVRI